MMKTLYGLSSLKLLDHVVAVGPGVRIIRVFALAFDLALGVAVARHVEPVAAPALAVMRRGEQAIHDFREGVGRFVLEETRPLPPASAAGR